MCCFGYHIYDECGHKCIELITYCVNRLWMAGMHGRLRTCPELKYSRHVNELAPLTWEGMYGYCKQCQHEYAVRLAALTDKTTSLMFKISRW